MIKWAKFKRYIKEWKEETGIFFSFFTLLSRSPCLPFFPANHKKNEKQKQKKLFLHKWVRSWLAYPESLCFQVFSLFFICHDRTRCMAKSICSQEDKKKNFLFLFLIRHDRTKCIKNRICNQGRKQSETKTINM